MYLGAVDGLQQDRNGDEIGWLQPIFEVCAENEWRPADRRDFPPRGKVFWFRPTTVVKGTLVFFDADGPDKKQPDHFSVRQFKPAHEVLDLRGLGDLDDVRRVLVRGLRPPLATKARRVYILCPADELVGPIELQQGEDDLFHLGKRRDKIPYFEAGAAEVREVKFDGATRLVVASTKQPAPDGFLDWDPDERVLIRALRTAARTEPRGTEIDLTERRLNEIAQQIAQGETSADWFHRRYRIQRALQFVGSVRETRDLAAAVVRELRKQPQIQHELDAERERLKATWREELDAELTAARETLDHLTAARETSEAELGQLQTRVARRRAAVNEEIRKVEDDLQRRLAELLERPEKLFSEMAILRAIVERPATRRLEPPNRASARVASRSHPTVGADTLVVADLNELKGRLRKAFKARGLHPRSAKRLHAAVTGGLTPVLLGPRSADALAAFANTVSGGRITWVRVGPGVLDVRDLFGAVENGEFAPHYCGLAEVCCQPPGAPTHLVVIDGANRAPLEGFLLPLLGVVRGLSGYGRLFSPEALQSTPQYGALAELDWPPNVILTVTLTEGPTALPVPPQLWAHAALVEVQPTDVKGDAPAPSQVSVRGPCFEPGSAHDVDGLLETAAELGLPDCGDAAVRFAAGYSRLESDSDAVLREAEAVVLHPACATTPWIGDKKAEAALCGGAVDAETTPLRERLRRLRAAFGER